MRTRRGIVAFTAALTLMLAGCSGGADDNDPDGGAPSGAAGTGRGQGTTPTTKRTPQPKPKPKAVTIAASGDILSHAPVIANAQTYAGGGEDDYDFSPMFAKVTKKISAADIAICHMETPLSADNTNLTVPRTLVFNTPHQVADALAKAGYDGCDFASNHTWDQGLDGLGETEQVLRDAGLNYAGPVAKKKAKGPAWYEVKGVKVAQLAYTYTIYNAGLPNDDVPPEAPWLSSYLWKGVGAKGIIKDARRARTKGADFVVVSMHWGNEYQTEPTEEQREIARAVLKSGAVDLILGTHVHVIQPCEKINGRYVIYGLGNFLSNQSPDTTLGKLREETQEGMIAQFTLKKSPQGKVTSTMTFQPTRVDIDSHTIELATPKKHSQTYERVVETMGMLGDNACDAKPMR